MLSLVINVSIFKINVLIPGINMFSHGINNFIYRINVFKRGINTFIPGINIGLAWPDWIGLDRIRIIEYNTMQYHKI